MWLEFREDTMISIAHFETDVQAKLLLNSIEYYDEPITEGFVFNAPITE